MTSGMSEVWWGSPESDDDLRTCGDDGAITVGPAVVPTRRSQGWFPLLLGSGEDAWFVGPLDDPDRYELIGEGLAGGEGILWRARYRGSLRSPLELAVKLIRRPADAPSTWPTAEDRRRWQDQAVLLRHLDVDHLVRVYETFTGPSPHSLDAGHSSSSSSSSSSGSETAYIVMEWVDGPTLDGVVRGVPATADSLAERLGYVRDIAEAVATLHSWTRSGGNPALHRDVKPGNCLVHPTRGVVLADLSGMRLIADGVDPAGMHTPAYTAPEVLAAPRRSRSPGSDLWSGRSGRSPCSACSVKIHPFRSMRSPTAPL